MTSPGRGVGDVIRAAEAARRVSVCRGGGASGRQTRSCDDVNSQQTTSFLALQNAAASASAPTSVSQHSPRP